ncbi:MAG: aldo/keto reductase, partial [Bdellovibrionaceae bacterium]|nr:aldo/keto reductase [Pseudobdellovibrionaceae bacterium]
MNIIVGTWQLGGSSWATVKEADVYKTIEQTIQLGCRHFDTAPTYGDGRSESALGKILSEAPSYKFTITTKVSPDQLKFDQLVKSVELSLQRLKVSSVGNLLIHWPAGTMNTEMVSLEEISRGLEYIKKQGYAEKIGVCNYSLLELNNLEKLISLDTVQYPLSAVYRVVEPEILNHVLEKKYDIQAYSPLGQGLLAPKKQITKPQDGDHRNWVRLYNK